MTLKIYVVSYKDEGEWNEPYKACIAQYNELGYDVNTIEGYNFKNLDCRKSQICYKNFLELFLIDCIKCIASGAVYEGFIYSEDDVYLNEEIIIENKSKINWLGYWRRDKNNKMYGSSVIYIPSEKIKSLYTQMKNHKARHLDYYFDLHVEDKIIRPTPICLEIPHISLNTNSERRHKFMKR